MPPKMKNQLNGKLWMVVPVAIIVAYAYCAHPGPTARFARLEIEACFVIGGIFGFFLGRRSVEN